MLYGSFHPLLCPAPPRLQQRCDPQWGQQPQHKRAWRRGWKQMGHRGKCPQDRPQGPLIRGALPWPSLVPHGFTHFPKRSRGPAHSEDLLYLRGLLHQQEPQHGLQPGGTGEYPFIGLRTLSAEVEDAAPQRVFSVGIALTDFIKRQVTVWLYA